MPITFVRTDEPSPMHEVALNLFGTDFRRYVDVRASAVLIGPGLALTARHNIEIFEENYRRARASGEAGDAFAMIAAQTWREPPATIVHIVRDWFAAPWTDLAVLRLEPANTPAEQIPSTYHWRAMQLDVALPGVGTEITAFGFDQVDVTHSEGAIDVRAHGVTATGAVQELLAPILGNPLHGWYRFRTNARFDGGMSGGPVVTASGRVCGVVSTSLPARTEDEEHASFVPLLWPGMAIEVLDPRDLAGPKVTLLDLARAGIIKADGHEHVEVTRDADGQVVGVQYQVDLG